MIFPSDVPKLISFKRSSRTISIGRSPVSYTHLIYEIVDNAVDEHLAGYCSNIQVILDEDGTATIQDNGRGIPTGINSKTGIPAVEMVFTMLHAGGKFGTGGYKDVYKRQGCFHYGS